MRIFALILKYGIIYRIINIGQLLFFWICAHWNILIFSKCRGVHLWLFVKNSGLLGLSKGHFCRRLNRISIRWLRLFGLDLFLLCLDCIEIVLFNCEKFLMTVTYWFNLRNYISTEVYSASKVNVFSAIVYLSFSDPPNMINDYSVNTSFTKQFLCN